MQEFMGGIEDMVRDLVQTYHSVSEEQKSMFGGGAQGINAGTALGKCPKCGGDVVKGKFGAYCKNKCGMNVGRAMGAVLSDSQIKSMLEGKKTLVKGLKGKKAPMMPILSRKALRTIPTPKTGRKSGDHSIRLGWNFRSVRNRNRITVHTGHTGTVCMPLNFRKTEELNMSETMENAALNSGEIADRTPAAKAEETKADKFIRLGEYRMNKAIDAIGRIENLANRSAYEYTPEQVEAMFSVLESKVAEVKAKFTVTKNKENAAFSFGNKAGQEN